MIHGQHERPSSKEQALAEGYNIVVEVCCPHGTPLSSYYDNMSGSGAIRMSASIFDHCELPAEIYEEMKHIIQLQKAEG